MRKWLWDLGYYFILWFWYVFLVCLPTVIILIVMDGGDPKSFDADSNPYLMPISIAAMAVATLLLGRAVTKEKLSSFLTVNTRQMVWGIAVGTFVMGVFVILQLLLKSTAFSWHGFTGRVALLLVMYWVAAFTEELLFRQLLFGHLIKKLETKYAILVGSALFGLFHCYNDHLTWIGLLNITLFGVLASLFYLRDNNLSMPLGFHFAWNFLQGPILGYAVSGYQDDSLLNADTTTRSANFLNGGSFGAEGSLLLTVIIVILILLYRTESNFTTRQEQSA